VTEKKTPDTFARLLERKVRDVLGNKYKDTKAADVLKAIDLGVKVCALRAKLNLKPGEKDDESFFG